MKQVVLRVYNQQMIFQVHQTKYTIYKNKKLKKIKKNKTDELLEILDTAAFLINSPYAFVRDLYNGDDFSIFLASNQKLQNLFGGLLKFIRRGSYVQYM